MNCAAKSMLTSAPPSITTSWTTFTRAIECRPPATTMAKNTAVAMRSPVKTLMPTSGESSAPAAMIWLTPITK